jgi:hypothetical protein
MKERDAEISENAFKRAIEGLGETANRYDQESNSLGLKIQAERDNGSTVDFTDQLCEVADKYVLSLACKFVSENMELFKQWYNDTEGVEEYVEPLTEQELNSEEFKKFKEFYQINHDAEELKHVVKGESA